MKSFYLILSCVIFYLIFPFFAGLFVIGGVLGPKVYLVNHHRLLYRIGYSFFHDEIPRNSLSFERPYFYGFEGKKTKFYYEEKNKDAEFERLKKEAKEKELSTH